LPGHPDPRQRRPPGPLAVLGGHHPLRPLRRNPRNHQIRCPRRLQQAQQRAQRHAQRLRAGQARRRLGQGL
ncbi:hypothetical protein IWW52_006980, partial [Coemansia sp. RSA 2704]